MSHPTSSSQSNQPGYLESRENSGVENLHVGFIGLGVMGEPMCRNLCNRLLKEAVNGNSLRVFDLDAERLRNAVSAGAIPAESVAELSQQSNIILMSLPGGKEVEAVLTGEGGVVSHAAAGSLIIDCSTTSVSLTRTLANKAAERGLEFIDSPVARTRAAAETGTLAMMVGGEQAHFERALPLLSCMASDVLHVGAVGCGQMAKILNNMVLFQTVAALAEAQTMANRAGLSTERLFDALAQGSANSFALGQHGRQSMQTGEFPLQAFSVEYARKDLSYALQLAAETGTEVTGAKNVDELFGEAIEQGSGEQYWPVILKLLQQQETRKK